MRPPGEARLALLRAAVELTTVARSPTLRELTAYSRVGSGAALCTVKHMVKAKLLVIVRDRKVPYRNRPVAEYAPAPEAEPDESADALCAVFKSWIKG